MSKTGDDNNKLVTSDTLTAEMTDSEKQELDSLFDTDVITIDCRKIAVLSDIHSNMVAFNAVLDDLKTQEYDIILSLGDLVGYYTEPEEVIQNSIELFDYGVMGNHDFAAIEPQDLMYSTLNNAAQMAIDHNRAAISNTSRSYLAKQPMKMIINTSYGSITAVHGDPLTIFGYIYGKNQSEMELEILKALSHANTEFLFVGHTHIQGFYQSNMGQIYLNPGAVGQPRDKDPRAAYAIIDLMTRTAELRRVEYDISVVQNQVHICEFPASLAERLAKGE